MAISPTLRSGACSRSPVGRFMHRVLPYAHRSLRHQHLRDPAGILALDLRQFVAGQPDHDLVLCADHLEQRHAIAGRGGHDQDTLHDEAGCAETEQQAFRNLRHMNFPQMRAEASKPNKTPARPALGRTGWGKRSNRTRVYIASPSLTPSLPGMTRRRSSSLRLQLQRGRVDAVAQAGRAGAVVEDVAEMAVALRAQHLGADHAVAGIAFLVDMALDRGLGEARPAAAGIELGVGLEQRLAAAGADIGARRVSCSYSPENGRSVAFSRSTAYCIGVNSLRHSVFALLTLSCRLGVGHRSP